MASHFQTLAYLKITSFKRFGEICFYFEVQLTLSYFLSKKKKKNLHYRNIFHFICILIMITDMNTYLNFHIFFYINLFQLSIDLIHRKF